MLNKIAKESYNNHRVGRIVQLFVMWVHLIVPMSAIYG